MKKRLRNVIKSLSHIFKRGNPSPKGSQNQDNENLTEIMKEEYPTLQEYEDLSEEYEDELDGAPYDFFEKPPEITPSANLPDGWVWVDYWDGSGSLNSPDGKHYFSYDLHTGEYHQCDNEEWRYWGLPMFLAMFKDFAEKEMLKRLCE